MGSVGIPPITFELQDLTTPNGMIKFNDWVEKLTMAVNTQAGLHGPVSLANSLDMGGNRIMNLAAPVSPTDAVHLQSAQQNFGPAAVAPQLEATGTNPLQTVMRLNDQQQRVQFSTFLNDVLNLPPTSNTSNITVVAAGANSTITVSAGTYKWGDQSTAPYAQRIDTVANPGAGVNIYYYFLRKIDTSVQVLGPFTSDNSSNQLAASFDGRGYLGKVVVNVGGGGTAGGGSDPPADGGCTEIGTPLTFPDGAGVSVAIEPCSEWYEVLYHDGKTEEKISFACGTLIGMFQRVNDKTMWAARKDGRTGKIINIHYAERKSWKQVVRVRPQGTYWVGDGEWWVHNAKILS